MKSFVRRHPILKGFLKWGRDALKASYRMPILLFEHPAERGFLLEWMATAGVGRQSIDTKKPMLTFRASKWLDDYITAKSVVFEWGSGGSTIFFAERAIYTVSVEHDPDWYEQMARRLKRLPSSKYQHVLIEPESFRQGEHRDSCDPQQYASGYELDLKFERYVRFIDGFRDHMFDLILVDGRARPSCVIHAIPKLKPHGVLIFDDAHRPRYERGVRLLRGWKRIDLSGLRYQRRVAYGTTIAWRKPTNAPSEMQRPREGTGF